MSAEEHIQHRVAEIISTEKRKSVFNAILAHAQPFSVSDIFNSLSSTKLGLKMTSVLNVIKSLHYAGFLTEETEPKPAHKEGRPRNLYRIAGKEPEQES